MLALALGLTGCVSLGSYGEPAAGFVTPAIGRAFIPLAGSAYVVLEGRGAAVAIAPGLAVTDAHNAGLVDSKNVIGTSKEYDLLFFRTAAAATLPTAAPRAGETVIAYGQGDDGGLRDAHGVVRWLDAPVLPRCDSCAVQHAFAFEADAGPGFSGGPVVDAGSGALVGIVFGYRDIGGKRYMYAYDMGLVERERVRVEQAAASPP